MDKNKFLVSNAPVAREVEFADGTKETLYFKQLNAGEFRRFQHAEQSDDDATKFFAMQRLIGASLCDEKGKLVLTDQDCIGLTVAGVKALFPHVTAVAGIGAATKKASPSAEANGSDTP